MTRKDDTEKRSNHEKLEKSRCARAPTKAKA